MSRHNELQAEYPDAEILSYYGQSVQGVVVRCRDGHDTDPKRKGYVERMELGWLPTIYAFNLYEYENLPYAAEQLGKGRIVNDMAGGGNHPKNMNRRSCCYVLLRTT